MAASCGGHCIAIFQEEKIADALDYIANNPNSKFMHLYQGEWDVDGEIPIASKLKSILIQHPDVKTDSYNKRKICSSCCYSDGVECFSDGSWKCWRCSESFEP